MEGWRGQLRLGVPYILVAVGSLSSSSLVGVSNADSEGSIEGGAKVYGEKSVNMWKFGCVGGGGCGG